jgi:hypothetical protein
MRSRSIHRALRFKISGLRRSPTKCLPLLFSLATREIWGIAGGKRFFERFVHLFF